MPLTIILVNLRNASNFNSGCPEGKNISLPTPVQNKGLFSITAKGREALRGRVSGLCRFWLLSSDHRVPTLLAESKTVSCWICVWRTTIGFKCHQGPYRCVSLSFLFLQKEKREKKPKSLLLFYVVLGLAARTPKQCVKAKLLGYGDLGSPACSAWTRATGDEARAFTGDTWGGSAH